MEPSEKSQIYVFDPGRKVHRDFALGPFERDFLAISRCFFQTHDEPQSQCWMHAFLEAEQRFPAPFGATIAHAISLVTSALQTSRSGKFSYFQRSDALADEALTIDEKYLVKVLRGMRAGDRPATSSAALLLCQGGHSAEFLAAMERLCIVTGDVQDLFYNS